MTSTHHFWDFIDPILPLSPQNLYCLFANLLHFLTTLPLICGRHIWKSLKFGLGTSSSDIIAKLGRSINNKGLVVQSQLTPFISSDPFLTFMSSRLLIIYSSAWFALPSPTPRVAFFHARFMCIAYFLHSLLWIQWLVRGGRYSV